MTFDLIPTDSVMDQLGNHLSQYDNSDSHDNHVSQQTKDMGYDSPNPIENVFGTATIVVSAIVLAFVILFLLKLAVGVAFPEIDVLLQKLKKIIFWNTILRFWLEEFLTISIANLIKLYALDFTNWYEFLMSASSIASMIMIIATPYIIYRFLKKNHEKIETE